MAFTGYTNGGFDALSAGLNSLGNAYQNYQKQQKLDDLGQKLQAGDIPGAAKIAFDAGDSATGLKLMTLGLQQKSSQTIAPLLGMPTEPGVASASPTSAGVSPASVGGFGNAVNRTLGFEGGLNPNDSNGTPSNYGINAAANPSVDVPNLNRDQAVAIYKKQYWDPLGLDNVDPRLAHVVFDTAVNAGPGKAQELMDASGGDPNKFLALRQQFQNGLAQSNPDKYGQYAGAWNNRIASLRADINAPGGGTQVASADDSFAPQGKTGAVASDDANAAKRTYLQTAQSRLIAAMAQPNLDSGTQAALKAKLDVVNKNLSDIKTEEDKSVSTVSREDFATAFPGQNYPPNAIVQKDAAGKYSIVRTDNERVPNLSAQAEQRKQILVGQGIDPASPQGQEYILNGKVPEVGLMKPTEQKMYSDATNKVLTLQQSIDQLNQAKQLNDTAYSGNYQPGAAAWAHRNLPSAIGDTLADPKRVAATTQFTNLVTSANASLGKDMFGARVTNYDEQLLQKMKAGDFMAPDERAMLLNQAIAMRQEALAKAQGDVAQMKAGTRFQRAPIGQQQGQQQAAQRQQASDVLGQARDAIARGADRNAVIQRLQQNGMDASGL